MSDELKMPQMGYDMKEGTIVRWLIETGSRVNKNQVIAEIETDKAVVEFQTYLDGFITEILVQEGSTVAVGEAIALVGQEDEIIEAKPKNLDEAQVEEETDNPEKTDPPVVAIPTAPSKTESVTMSVKASPVARKLAIEKGFDLNKIVGTGPAGRVTREDVESYSPPDSSTLDVAEIDEQVNESVSLETSVGEGLTRMRQQIARVTVKSKTEIPHFYISVDIDMTKAMEMRKQINQSEGYEGLDVSINDLILKACVVPLIKYPKFNSSFSENGIVSHSKINIGIAISQEAGLIVPAIMDMGSKSLKEICLGSKDLTKRSNEGSITTDEYARGTFAVSNLGMFNVKSFVGIIYPPQAAMLAVGSVTKKPIVFQDDVIVADIMTATISGDHRIVDGAEGALFVNEIKTILENPYQLLI